MEDGEEGETRYPPPGPEDLKNNMMLLVSYNILDIDNAGSAPQPLKPPASPGYLTAPHTQ